MSLVLFDRSNNLLIVICVLYFVVYKNIEDVFYLECGNMSCLFYYDLLKWN